MPRTPSLAHTLVRFHALAASAITGIIVACSASGSSGSDCDFAVSSLRQCLASNTSGGTVTTSADPATMVQQCATAGAGPQLASCVTKASGNCTSVVACFAGGIHPPKDSSVPQEEDGGTTVTDAKPKKDAISVTDSTTPGVCTPGSTAGFVPTATNGVVAAHQGACTQEQLKAFVNCLKDFNANAADCNAWGFDPSKSVSTAFTGTCGTCLFALPDKPGTALKVEVIGQSAYLGLNEVACLDAFGGTNCGKNAQAVNECAAEACGADDGCTTTPDIQTCYQKAIPGACSTYTQAAVNCVDGTTPGKTTSTFISDASKSTNPSVDICGQLATFSGNDTPDAVTYALGNYFCGSQL